MGLAEAVLRLQDRLDVPVFLRPVAGVRDLSAAIEKDPAHLVVTDGRLGQQGPRGDRGVERRVGELEAVRRAHPGLPVRVVSGHPGPAFPRRLRRAGAGSLPLSGEPPDPAALGLAIAELVWPGFPTTLVRAFPPGLRPDHHLLLARGVLDPDVGCTVLALAKACEYSGRTLRRDIQQAGLDEAELCLALRVFGAFHRSETRGESLARARRRFGFRTAGAFRDACVLVAGEDHEAVDEQGGSACVALELTVRWSGRPAASGGLPGRPGSSEGPAPVIGPHDPAPDPELTHLLEDRRKAAMQAGRKRGAPEDIVEDAGGHLTLKAVERAGRDRTPLKELLVKGPFTHSYAWTAGWNYAADQLARKDRQHLSPPEGERSTTTDDEWLSLSDPEARRDLVTETPPPDAAVPFVEPIKRLEAVVEALPEPRRTVVWLRRFGALPQKEVARVLDTTANAVKLQARRAWRAVKVRLGNPEL